MYFFIRMLSFKSNFLIGIRAVKRDRHFIWNPQCEKMALFRYFQKTEKTLREHFQEASNNKSSEIGLSRVESESVAESLEVVKSGKYLTNIQENDTNSCNGMNMLVL